MVGPVGCIPKPWHPLPEGICTAPPHTAAHAVMGGSVMRVRRLLGICAVVLVACGLAAPVSAQLTTGTITGTVKDTQGGVLPGAIVLLTSETRGTQIAAAVSNSDGDFVLANVPPDTYVLDVSMEGFKTLRR